ncbi:two-component regulator propeller domain-containing protein [Dokdonia pacifica]|uniref:Por secretion system C-terminal sorting domain-containing protein n=1 Tax=Dokdonia pacifica TaxID=1627892 RepID=A0A238VRV7_9FLAO|nr:two-component regulator propeller domain-containing protein [Dokdonia pacifica]SNR37070.1 Por secretion system C-terminal sorting domain-containing protein [Dokdonia pacifica]
MKKQLFLIAVMITLTTVGQTFTNYTEADGLFPSLVNEIIEDDDGDIWCVGWLDATSPGIARFNGESWELFGNDDDGPHSNTFISLLQDKTGAYWFGSVPSEGNQNGASRFNGFAWAYFPENVFAGTAIEDIAEGSFNDLWFATNGGLTKFDSNIFTSYTIEDGLPSNSITSVIQDKNGDIWVTTFDGGASKFDGTTFTNYTVDDGLASNELTRVFEDRSGNIWFASGFSNAGLTRFDGNSFTIFTTADGLAANNVREIAQDDDDNLWFAGSAGVTRFDGENWLILNESNGLLSNLVRGIEPDRDGNIWFGTLEGVSVLEAGSLSAGEENLTTFSVFPNPVEDQLMIQTPNTSEILKVNLYSVLGELIASQDNTANVDMSTLSSGIYFAEILGTNQQSQTIKVIKK